MTGIYLPSILPGLNVVDREALPSVIFLGMTLDMAHALPDNHRASGCALSLPFYSQSYSCILYDLYAICTAVRLKVWTKQRLQKQGGLASARA